MESVFAAGVPLISKVAPVARNVALYPLDVIALPSPSLERSKIVTSSLFTKLFKVGSTL